MNTIIRAHIKNTKRLRTLEQEIDSWYKQRLDILGDIVVVDDHSPLEKELKELCDRKGVVYYNAGGKPDTKNGLYYSLKFAQENDPTRPVLACVDDALFGKNILPRLVKFLADEEPRLPAWGMTGLFACYEDDTRQKFRVKDTELWYYPNSIIYGLVGHVFSPMLRDIVVDDWEKVLIGERPYPESCDDIWVKNLTIELNIPNFNTMWDYVQHTGGDNRTFGPSGPSSDYFTRKFIGV